MPNVLHDLFLSIVSLQLSLCLFLSVVTGAKKAQAQTSSIANVVLNFYIGKPRKISSRKMCCHMHASSCPQRKVIWLLSETFGC